jgi:hypothetical protein
MADGDIKMDVVTADDQDFNRLNQWLENIHTNVEQLLIKRYILREVDKIIQTNPRIHKPSSFYQWMGNVYFESAAMGIRRQIDRDTRSISFVRMLDEIQRKPEILSRGRFVSLYSDPNIRALIADREFDRLVGDGRSYINPDDVRKDSVKLQEKAEKVERFATKRIAHLDEVGPTIIPTFQDLDDCLDFLEQLLRKYLMLFRARSDDTIVPVWQYDWTAIFREPWIDS